MQQHFFCGDGALYDTRQLDWHKKPPLRAIFRQYQSNIDSVAQFKAALRAGAYAWPGGYPLYFLLSDGETMCYACARKHFRNMRSAIETHSNAGWRIVACDVNYEDNEMYCANCNAHMACAYGEG